jgi:lactoylglutathione lyase
MKIEHVALWCGDLEKMRDFYANYFGGVCGALYKNAKTGFSSYFLTFEDGCRLELMHRDGIPFPASETLGYSHFAFSVKNVEEVEKLTQMISKDGYEVMSEPRLTGDGYYESVILDPENNRVEIAMGNG